MSDSEDDYYSVTDEVKALNNSFQSKADFGGVSLDGTIGYHALFNHEHGLDFAGQAALHGALDETLMELALDPDIVRENHGEVTPATMAGELREQLQAFTAIGDRFGDRLAENFEEKLRGYEKSLEAADSTTDRSDS